jgi:hypothetical protein
MSMTNDDVVGTFLNEQARVNALNDEGDVNIVVEDIFTIGASPIEEVGFEAGAAEIVTPIEYGGSPHRFDDDDMVWGFFTWA